MVMHLRTQDDQPYGSVRKCCERCGLAFFAATYEYETDSIAEYNAHPDRCNKPTPKPKPDAPPDPKKPVPRFG